MSKSVWGSIREEGSLIRESKSLKQYWQSRKKNAEKDWRSFQKNGLQVGRALYEYSRENPKEAACRFALFCIGFQAGSGGPDGDGGIPDLDWTLFEEHRSILTHSIVPGIVIEVIVGSFVDLVGTIHSNLPVDHDPLWDSIRVGARELALIAHGASVGIGAHLGVDATLDGGGSYADLPFSLPQEGHQAISMGNALIEGLDGVARSLSHGDTVQTFASLTDAKKAVLETKSPSSYKINRLENDNGFKVLWCPRRT